MLPPLYIKMMVFQGGIGDGSREASGVCSRRPVLKMYFKKRYTIYMKQQKTTWQGYSTKRHNSAFFLFVFLGMLTAFGPFVTDMYLPSLPAMTQYFGASVSMVQLGLTFSMLGLAAGQLVFGPLSDKYGRRAPLLVSMVLFLISTLGCIFSPSIELFVLLRFVQGIAGAGGIVISRSIATDKFKGANLAKALAIVGAINGIAPVAAPVVGGAVLKVTNWRGVFAVLFVLGIVLFGCCVHFNESLSRVKRSKESLYKTFSLFKTVVCNRKFMLYVLQMAFAQGMLFGYIAASAFIIQEHYGFTPFAFSLFFAVNAVAIGTGAAMSVKFKRQENCVLTSCAGMLVCSVAVLGSLLAGANVWVFEALLFVMLFMMGLSFTASTALAMDAVRSQAGTGSALLGAAGFLFGSVVSPLVGMGNMLVSTGVTFVVCAVCSGACALLAREKHVVKEENQTGVIL